MRLSYVVAVFVAFAAIVFSCGDPSDPLNTTTLNLKGGSDTYYDIVLSEAKFDASARVVATGDGDIEVDSIEDSATSKCEFLFSPVSAYTDIQIVNHPSLCTDTSKCIVCDPQTEDGRCSISCSGTIPSDPETAQDTFNIYIIYTNVFQSSMSHAQGMIRFDVITEDWPEFDLFEPFSIDLSECDGAPDMTVSLSDPAGIDSFSAASYTKGLTIEDIDTSPNDHGLGRCAIAIAFKAVMNLTGADIPDYVLDLSRGDLIFSTKICNEIVNCLLP